MDPLDSASEAWPVLTFNAVELAWLVERGLLPQPSSASPARGLWAAGRGADAAARGAAQRRLEALGLAAPPQDEESACGALLFHRALALACRPAVAVHVARREPSVQGEEIRSLLPLLLSEAAAAPAFVDQDGLHVGAPVSRRRLGLRLRRLLEPGPAGLVERADSGEGSRCSQALPEVSQLRLDRLAVRALEALAASVHPELTTSPSPPAIHRRRLLEALATSVPQGHLALRLLEWLEGEGLLAPCAVQPGRRRPSAEAWAWLRRFASGHRLDLFALDCVRESSASYEGNTHSEVATRLSFIGAPGACAELVEGEQEAALTTLTASPAAQRVLRLLEG